MKTTRGLLFVLFIVGVLGISASAIDDSTSYMKKATEAVVSNLPKESTCTISNCLYEYDGRGDRAGRATFRGIVQNKSLAAETVAIHAGFKESYSVQKDLDIWFIQEVRQTTLQAGEEKEQFRLVVPSPRDAQESIERGLLVPVVEVRSVASGVLLDATVPSFAGLNKNIREFDPTLLSQEQVKPLKSYEIVWSATLAKPGSSDPAQFAGVLRNPEGKNETVLLRTGFINVLNRRPSDEGWTWHSDTEISVTAQQDEVPFQVKVDCPSGIYVGISRNVYKADVTLWTQVEQEQLRLAEERSKRPRSIPSDHVLLDPQIQQMEVKEAIYAYTRPGQPNNAGHFEFVVVNQSEEPRTVVLRYGFMSTDAPDPRDPGAWHFTQERSIRVDPGKPVPVGDDVRCHVKMEELIDAGRYDVYILVFPQSGP